MSSTLSLVTMVLTNLVYSLPALITCGVAIALLVTRRGPGTAIAGFGIIAGFALLTPILYGALNFAQSQGEIPISNLTWIYPIIGVASTLAHCMAYILLLLALLRFLRPAQR